MLEYFLLLPLTNEQNLPEHIPDIGWVILNMGVKGLILN